MTYGKLTERVINLFRGEGERSLMAREASASTLVRFLSIGMAFIMHLVLARILKLENYGIVVYVEAYILILSVVAKAGLDDVLVKYVPIYFQGAQWSFLRGLLKATMLWSLLLASLVTAVSAGVVMMLVGPGALRTAFLLALLSLPFHVITGLMISSVRAMGHAAMAVLPLALIRPFVTIAAGFSGWLLLGDSIEAWHGIVFLFAGLIAAITAASIMVSRTLWKKVPSGKSEHRFREWGLMGINVWFISAFELALHQTDIVMVGMFLGMRAAAVYSVGVRISRIVLFGQGGIAEIAAPLFAGLHAKGAAGKLQSLIHVAGRGILLYSLPCVIAILIGGRWILALFGVGFAEGYLVLLILVLARMISAITGPSHLLLMMTNYEALVCRLLAGMLVANIVLNYYLISVIGISGAALATFITTVCWKGLLTLEVKKHMGLDMLIGVVPAKRKAS